MGGHDVLRVAVLGIGYGDAVLVPAFRRDERVRLVGVCASTEERARPVAARLGVPGAWGDWRAVVASSEVDAIAIAVPPALQPEIVREAARHKKHVFCEKPLGLDRRSTAELHDVVKAAGIAHAIDFEFCELASWKRAREVRQEAASSWRHFSLTWRVETRAHKLGGHPWKTTRELGGGALLGFGSHVVHGIEWMLGRIERVAARFGPPDAPAERRVDAWVELEGGLSGSIAIATDVMNGTGFCLELYGDDRVMRLENRTGDHLRNFVLEARSRSDGAFVTLVDERRPSEGEATPAPTTDGRIEPVASLVRRFVDAALGGAPATPGIDQGVRVDAVLDAMRTAHETGAWQETR